MTKITFVLHLLKGAATVGFAGFMVLEIRDALLANFGIAIPEPLYQMLAAVFVFGAIPLGFGKFIAQLKEDHEKQKKPDKES